MLLSLTAKTKTQSQASPARASDTKWSWRTIGESTANGQGYCGRQPKTKKVSHAQKKMSDMLFHRQIALTKLEDQWEKGKRELLLGMSHCLHTSRAQQRVKDERLKKEEEHRREVLTKRKEDQLQAIQRFRLTSRGHQRLTTRKQVSARATATVLERSKMCGCFMLCEQQPELGRENAWAKAFCNQ